MLNKIAKKYKIKLIILYGSYVYGGKRPEDIDIAIVSEKNIALAEYTELIHFFSLHFKAAFKDIDLAVLNQATSPILQFQIAKNSKLLWGR